MENESLFDEIARRHRIARPAFFAPEEEWLASCRRVWACFPAWGADAAWLAEAAQPFLPRILAQMGFEQAIGRVSVDPMRAWAAGIPRPDNPRRWSWRWVVRHAQGLPVPLRGRGSAATGLALRGSDGEVLYFDEYAHDWMCPELTRVGHDLIDLAEWRWGVGAAKAAFRIAKLCGYRRPLPPLEVS